MAKKKLDPKLSELWSIKEATEFLKKHKTTLGHHIKEQTVPLPLYMRGALTMVRRDDIRALKTYLRNL